MDKDEIFKKITDDTDYIRCPKCSNSLSRFLAKNSEGVENKVIARLLMIPEDQVEKLYEEAVDLLKEKMIELENE